MFRNIIIFAILLFFFSCDENSKERVFVSSKKNNTDIKENKSLSKNEAYLNIKIDDTLVLNEIKEIQIKFAHSIDKITDVNPEDLKIVSGCVVFSTKEGLADIVNEFDIKCDSIFSPSIGINDTVLFKFNYKPSKPGRSFILLKLSEKNYLNPHKDSIRMVDFEYVFKKDFFVLENK